MCIIYLHYINTLFFIFVSVEIFEYFNTYTKIKKIVSCEIWIYNTDIYIYMYIYFRNIYRARASHCCFSWWSFGSFVDPCRTFRQIYTAVFPTVAHYSDQKLVSWLGRYVGFRPLSVSGIAALYSEQKTGFPVARAVITARFRHMHGSFPTGSHISDKTLVSRENGNFWKTKKLVKPILRSGIGLTIFFWFPSGPGT